jgi:hypothetical protein
MARYVHIDLFSTFEIDNYNAFDKETEQKIKTKIQRKQEEY